MRRWVRVRKNAGRLLEDLGIQPDVFYRMTFGDITERNQDLITGASLQLSRMPVYDLSVEVAVKGDGYSLVCRTLHLTFLEILVGQRHFTGACASDATPTELFVRRGLGRVEVRGMTPSS